MNVMCWSSVIEGYKNVETGECETLTGCFREKVSEGSIFDENCWANTQSSRYWERTKVERCDELCNKHLCPEGTFCYPVCNIYC